MSSFMNTSFDYEFASPTVRRLTEELRIERVALIDNAFSDVVLRGLYYKGCARSKPEVLINFTDKENQVMTHSKIKSTEFAALSLVKTVLLQRLDGEAKSPVPTSP